MFPVLDKAMVSDQRRRWRSNFWAVTVNGAPKKIRTNKEKKNGAIFFKADQASPEKNQPLHSIYKGSKTLSFL